MNTSKIIKNTFEIKPTHFFFHNGKRFPFNFYIFEINGIYFQQNRKELFLKKEINILDENESLIDLKDEDINLFISFINKEEISLTKENVPSLYFLSKKYNIPVLIQETEEFIQDNNLSLQFLLFYQNNPQYSLEKFIEQLSDHFNDYIHNKSILNLNFPILYSIVEKVKNKQSPSENISIDFFNFLFDCIDKYHRKASILFKDIDFDKMPMMFFQRLLKYDSSEFDSIFINNEMLKTIYEKEGEIVRKEEEIKLKEKQIDEKMNQMNQLINSFKTRIDELEKELTKQNQNHIDSITILQQNQKLAKSFNMITIKYENILFDFLERKVCPTHYSVRSRNDCDKDGHYLKNWVFEVSNTGFINDWLTIDKHENYNELDHKAAVQIFESNLKDNTSSYRFLRIKLIGEVTGGDYYLTVSAVEFFGFLYE